MAAEPRRHQGSRLRRWGIAGALVLGAAALAGTALPLLWLRFLPPPFSAFMLRSHFSDPASGEQCRDVYYGWVDWDDISPHVRRAVVIAEDQRFLEHRGFDLKAIQRAVHDRARGKSDRLRGASTISQQVAKNLFLWPGRSVLRKAAEAWYTGWLELALPKRRILELYLNVAQFGPCQYGVAAAAAAFYGITPARLGPGQAAMLATVLPNPAQLKVDDPGAYTLRRSREIRRQLEVSRGAAWLHGL